MKTVLILISILLINAPSFSQSKKLEPVWVKEFYVAGGYTSFVEADNQNNVYVLVNYDTLKHDTLHYASVNRKSSALIKFDSSGNIIWSYLMQDMTRSIFSRDMLIDETGNCFVTGEYTGELQFNSSVVLDSNTYANQPNIFLVKINSMGSFEWARGFQNGYLGASLFAVAENVIGLKRNFNSNYYEIGDTMTGGDYSYGVALFDGTGNTLATKFISAIGVGDWTFTANGAGGVYSIILLTGDSILVDNIVVKKKNPAKKGYVVVDMDNDLNIKWIRNWSDALASNGSNVLNDREIISDDKRNLYFVAGFADTFIVEGQTVATKSIQSFFISKIDSTGSLKWIRQSSSTLGNEAGSVIGIKDNKLVITAVNYTNIISFDDFENIPSPAKIVIDATTSEAIDASKRINNAGFYAIGSTAEYAIQPLFANTDYIINDVTYNLKGDNDFLLIKMDSTQIVGIADSEKRISNIDVYPNPASTWITVSIKDVTPGKVKVIVIADIMGKEILSKKMSYLDTSNAIIDVSSLPVGIYIVKVQYNNGNNSIEKLLIQR